MFPVYLKPAPVSTIPLSELDCRSCNGRGTVSQEQLEAAQRGARLKRERLRNGLGLREAAELRGVPPSILCDIEAGRTFWEDLDEEQDLGLGAGGGPVG